MTMGAAASTASDGLIESAYREHSRKVLATLIRLLGDFDLAEEALHDAFVAAADRWPREGMPGNPSAWLVSAGRFKAIDKLRRRARFNAMEAEIADQLTADAEEGEDMEATSIKDDQLRLMFTCCHPVLPQPAQVALTLRELCGLTTEEISRAFLARPPALAQRIVRAKARIREERIPYEVPELSALPERLDAVLRVIYLVFNEGYSAHSGEALTRTDLSGEAIRLGRLMLDLLPQAETMGLLALMLLHESRRPARTTPDGEVVLLANQDRTLWDQALMAEGFDLIDRAFATRQIGPYTLQAAIAAVHARAGTAEDTDWGEIVGLYDVLMRAAPSPVVRLNRAVAVGMRDGPRAGLALVNGLIEEGNLADYHLTYAAQADFYRRAGETDAARQAYERALALALQEPERRFLQQRLRELGDAP
ncbi:RNA polymerase sigma factor [Devosia nitrariae]|uniref:DNA-directed RNA polymerase sigma-70 factor n=1 Tax=Devosia nitrariae TaxID=2071872 RepID=A0ABQ5W8C5_9HYPH|nr:RNA polymerase sigma factor [Devosia nitrariae]GLQ56360.1 DNA-directed RNA polymerase sigma-70 factor [Devosia nitrariae]